MTRNRSSLVSSSFPTSSHGFSPLGLTTSLEFGLRNVPSWSLGSLLSLSLGPSSRGVLVSHQLLVVVNRLKARDYLRNAFFKSERYLKREDGVSVLIGLEREDLRVSPLLEVYHYGLFKGGSGL